MTLFDLKNTKVARLQNGVRSTKTQNVILDVLFKEIRAGVHFVGYNYGDTPADHQENPEVATLKSETVRARSLKAAGGAKALGYGEIKKGLPAYIFAGAGDGGREVMDYSGLVYADFDEIVSVSDAEKVLGSLQTDPHCVACWKTLSGHKVGALYLVEPLPDLNTFEYAYYSVKQHLKPVGELDDGFVHSSHLATPAWDPELYVNSHPIGLKYEVTAKMKREVQKAFKGTLLGQAYLENLPPEHRHALVDLEFKGNGWSTTALPCFMVEREEGRPHTHDGWESDENAMFVKCNGENDFTFSCRKCERKQRFAEKRSAAGRPKKATTLLKEASPYFDGNMFNVVAMRDAIVEHFNLWHKDLDSKEGVYTLKCYHEDLGVYLSAEFPVKNFIRVQLGQLQANRFVSEGYAAVLESVVPKKYPIDRSLIACRNGVLDMRASVLSLREFSPEDHLEESFDFSFVGEEVVESEAGRESLARWDDYLRSLIVKDPHGQLDENVELLKQIIGSIPHKNVGELRSMFLLLGNAAGNNGKDFLLSLIGHLIGDDFCDAAPFSKLDKDFGLATLDSIYLLQNSEVQTRGVSLAVKRITTGDKMQINRKGVHQYNIHPYATVVGACNSLPRIPQDTDSFYERIHYLPFLDNFASDPAFSEEMTAYVQEHRDLIMTACILAYHAAYHAKKFRQTKFSEETRREHLEENDQMEAWISENLVERDLPKGIQGKELWNAFKDFAGQTGNSGRKTFYEKLKKRFRWENVRHSLTFFGVDLNVKRSEPEREVLNGSAGGNGSNIWDPGPDGYPHPPDDDDDGIKF